MTFIDSINIGLISVISLFLGLFLLIRSGFLFVDSSASFSKLTGLTELFVGLILSSIGTSLPEFSVSFIAALQREGDICLGNVFGTVIANIGLGFGISLLISAIQTEKEYITNCGFMMLTGVLSLLLAFDGNISRLEGILLISIFISYLYFIFKRRHAGENEGTEGMQAGIAHTPEVFNTLKIIIGMVFGLVGILISAKIIVWSAVNIAHTFGMPKLLIGATIIAIGTSIPEISSTAIAAYKKHKGLSLGIIIGSNIVDILFIIGFSSMFVNIIVNQTVIFFDIPFFVFLSILLLFFMRTGSVLSRTEGFVLLALYSFYIFSHLSFYP
ncbi:MAG: calcium/sodium antiporter [Candidatus Methanospirareceae archaeon]